MFNQQFLSPSFGGNEAALNPSRILVVDDDNQLRGLMADALLSAGHTVDCAENGARAWELVQLNHYDLMVTDNDMPGFTGVELLAKLRTSHLTLPVIMVTTVIPDQEFVKRPALMPEAILRKPFEMEQLLEKVKLVLRVGRREKFEAPSSWQNHAPQLLLHG